jgi:hypothetical protein
MECFQMRDVCARPFEPLNVERFYGGLELFNGDAEASFFNPRHVPGELFHASVRPED